MQQCSLNFHSKYVFFGEEVDRISMVMCFIDKDMNQLTININGNKALQTRTV